MKLLHAPRHTLGILLILFSCALLVSCAGVSSGSGGSGNNPQSTSYAISGTVTPGSMASGVTVTLSGAAKATTTTNSSGAYSFSGLANGSYTVTPSKGGVNFSPSSKPVTIKGASITGTNFTASLPPSWSISGSITPTAAAGGATVTLSGAATATTTADNSGNYVFNNLAAGAYTITPTKAGFHFSPTTQNAQVSSSNIGSLNFTTASDCVTGLGHANFYVATNGNDSWSGTLDCPNLANTDGPFASLAQAQQAVRGINSNPSAPITVMVRQGTYYLPLSPTSPGTLNFSASDSGTAQAAVTWTNYPNEVPVVSGGVPITGWKQASGNLWQASVPANTQAFEYLYYNNERRLRSRVQSPVAGVGYYMSGGSCISSQTGQIASTSMCNLGTFLRVAAEVPPTGSNTSCPSTSDGAGHSKCLDRFQYNPADPIAQWINLNPPSGNPCNARSSGNFPAGDIELTLFDAFTVDIMRVSCVDTVNHIIFFTGATQAGTAAQYSLFGPTAGHRYMVENAKDAFLAEQAAGQTGIWFLDRSTSTWTLNYVANYGENPTTDTVVIPQLGTAIPGAPATDYVGASLLFANNLNNVSFSGLTFEVDNFVPSPTGFNNDSNEEFPVAQAIDCESCQNVTFDSIIVRHTSGSAILVAATGGNSGAPSNNDLLENSAFYDIGAAGIRVGHTPSGGDRPQYVPEFINVQNNIVQGYSRVFPNGEGIAMGNGHDVTFSHNDIDDGYHAGASICNNGCPSYNWSANGVNISMQYNHIWNVMQGITSDGGALYYDTGMQTGSGTGDSILNNLIHDVTDSSIIDAGVSGSAYGGHGIYLDIQSAGIDVENNVVYRVASSGLEMTEGPAAGEPANTFNNNIVAYARRAMFQEGDSWPQNCTSNLRANITHNIFNFDLNEMAGFYPVSGCTDSCGMAYNQYQNFQGNLYWRTDGSFVSDPNAFYILNSPPPPNQASTCLNYQSPNQFTFLTFSQWQTGSPIVNGSPLPMNEDAGGVANVNPGFGTTGDRTDFLLPSAPIAGFNNSETNNTVNTAGRTNPVIVPPTVPGTYPTYVYSTSSF